MPSSTRRLFIPNNFWYNETSLSKLLGRFSDLEELSIGNRSLSVIATFDLYDKKLLKTLTIGKNSFTKSADSYGYDLSRSFEVLECPNLHNISIGDYSFSDYSYILRIENCSLLETIHFGKFSFVNIKEAYIMSMKFCIFESRLASFEKHFIEGVFLIWPIFHNIALFRVSDRSERFIIDD